MKPILGCIVVLVGLSGCGNLVGSGKLIDKGREVAPFSSVRVRDAIQIELLVGPPSVGLHIDDNLEPHLLTHVEDGVLIVEADRHQGDLRFSRDAVIRVTTPSVALLATEDSARISGSATGNEIWVSTSGSSQVDVTLSGTTAIRGTAADASRLNATGTAPTVRIEASGSAHVDGLTGREVEVDAQDAVEVTVRADNRVRVTASGSSVVTVGGQPPESEVKTTDAAKVVYRDLP